MVKNVSRNFQMVPNSLPSFEVMGFWNTDVHNRLTEASINLFISFNQSINLSILLEVSQSLQSFLNLLNVSIVQSISVHVVTRKFILRSVI